MRSWNGSNVPHRWNTEKWGLCSTCQIWWCFSVFFKLLFVWFLTYKKVVNFLFFTGKLNWFTNCNILFGMIKSIDEALPPTSMANFNHFSQRTGNDCEQNQQLETRTVYYRMPPNTSAPPNVMQSNHGSNMMGGMPSRGGPQRFSNSGKITYSSMHSVYKRNSNVFNHPVVTIILYSRFS